jgi:hypothetical protein
VPVPLVANDGSAVSSPGLATTAAGVKAKLELLVDPPAAGPIVLKPITDGPAGFDFTYDTATGSNGDVIHLTIKPNGAHPGDSGTFSITATLGQQEAQWVGAVQYVDH